MKRMLGETWMHKIGSEHFYRSTLCVFLLSACCWPAVPRPARGKGKRSRVKHLPTERVYHVGEAGPAGGIVFYDKGERSEDWRF